jgi:hypothetical protein
MAKQTNTALTPAQRALAAIAAMRANAKAAVYVPASNRPPVAPVAVPAGTPAKASKAKAPAKASGNATLAHAKAHAKAQQQARKAAGKGKVQPLAKAPR